MDKRLQQALEFSNFRMILATRQESLKVLLKNRLSLSYKGSLFYITPELITFVKTIIETNDSYILLDANDIPVSFNSTELYEFYEMISQKYKTAINAYYRDYQKLEEAREIRKVVNWGDDNEEK